MELCGLIRPRTAIPIHYEGWKHFRQGRDGVERELARAPEDVRARFRWLPIGEPVELPLIRPRLSRARARASPTTRGRSRS